MDCSPRPTAAALASQVPASLNGNGNIDAAEFARFIVRPTPGDFDRDGEVDAADLDVWRSALGSSARGDADGDGDSDGGDLLLWQRNLGTTLASATNVAVPEPGGATPALAAILGILALAASLKKNAAPSAIIYKELV